MLIGDRFFFEAFDVHKATLLIMVGITLTSHAPGSMLLKFVEIVVNYFLCCLFPAFRNGKGHNIPYHNAYSFGFTAGNTMASLNQKKLLAGQVRNYFLDKRQKKGGQRIKFNTGSLFLFYSVNIFFINSISCSYTSSLKLSCPSASTHAV